MNGGASGHALEEMSEQASLTFYRLSCNVDGYSTCSYTESKNARPLDSGFTGIQPASCGLRVVFAKWREQKYRFSQVPNRHVCVSKLSRIFASNIVPTSVSGPDQVDLSTVWRPYIRIPSPDSFSLNQKHAMGVHGGDRV